MKEFKGTKGEWFINRVHGIPIGVNAKIEIQADGTYSQTIVETLLPDTDEGWEKEEEETNANLKLIAAAPELLQFALEMVERYPQSPWIHEQAQKAINKALGNETT